MAKIVLKNFDELIVTDKEAERVSLDKRTKVDDITVSFPYTITHDSGMWVGTLKDVGHVFVEEKRVPTHFLTEENKHRFHNTHGYGKYQSRYEQGYGLLDVPTQYLIGVRLAKLSTDEHGRKSLIMLQSDNKVKYEELWQDYLRRLDPFNELT